VIDIRLWGQLVGNLTQINNNTVFAYDEAFNRPISPIVMPTRRKTPYKITNERFNDLPGFIYDSLPDAFGQKVMERYFKQHLKERDPNTFDYLTAIGSDGSGALEYVPHYDTERESTLFDINVLDQYAQHFNKEMPIEADIDEVDAFVHHSASLKGAKPKTTCFYDKASSFSFKRELLKESVEVIVKFTNVTDEKYRSRESQIEYAYYQLAREAGLTMAESYLFNYEGGAAFATERFDRVAEDKLHMLSAASLMHKDFIGHSDYQELFRLNNALMVGKEDNKKLFRQMVFNYIYNVKDDHLKNFSYLMDKDNQWSLSPAYDLIYNASINHHLTFNN
jgi:serine/threonine-protein kinase HipA